MLEIFIKGGSMMWFLLALSLAGLAVLLDRTVAFYRYSRIDNRSLRAKVLGLLAEDKIEQAALICADTPGPVSAVLLTGLQSYSRHINLGTRPESIATVMKEAMQDYSMHAMSAVEKRLYILSTVANAAPLFGMTGTVTGMITSFKAISEAGGIEANMVAAGISEALITTAAGLLIALFAVIPFNMFTTLSDRINLEIEETISEMMDFIATRMARKS